MSQAGAHDRHDDVGSVAEEAAKLIGSLTEWSRRHAEGDVSGSDPEAAAEACARCPVCRAGAWLRHLNPEARAHLGAAGASLAAAMASILAPPIPDSRGDQVERIVVDDEAWSD